MVYKKLRLLYVIEKDMIEELPLKQVYADYNRYIQSKDRNIAMDEEKYISLFKNFREYVLSLSRRHDVKVTFADNRPYNKF